MKTFLSILTACAVLYFGRDTETHVSIDETPAQHPLSKSPTLSVVAYQYARRVGETVEIAAHDVWESERLQFRLPIHLTVGDSVLLDKSSFFYQKNRDFQTLEAAFAIRRYDNDGQLRHLEGVLNYCVQYGEEVLCVSQIPIKVAFVD
ncbi:MAG: hypothetical protein JNL70_12230 [Saprospiraceae bacterium]|nr:hypothetical protein [Saprospiraceae bacterium]